MHYTHHGSIDVVTGVAHVYGVQVDTNKPTTGVFCMNRMAWIDDDITNGIDLAWERHVSQCDNEDHDSCGPCERGTILIGFKKGESGKYKEDPAAEYSAIVGETDIQVTRSKWLINGEWCSPCYPGQVDGDTEGPWLAYSVPPDVYESGEEKMKSRIHRMP